MFRETGAGPRGERSMAIETDHGEVQNFEILIEIIIIVVVVVIVVIVVNINIH